jgi:hypothetical protein
VLVEVEWLTMNWPAVTFVEATKLVAKAAAAPEVCGIKRMVEDGPQVGAVTVVTAAPVEFNVTVPVAFDRPSIN